MTTYTANKLYPIQPIGSNVGIWGKLLNDNLIDVLDQNLASIFTPNVSGNTDYVVSDADAQNLRHSLTGTLTGDISYILPARGSFYLISSAATGGSVTVKPVGGTGIIIPTSATFIYVNTNTLTVESIGSNLPLPGLRTVTADTSVLTTDDTILVDATAGDITVTFSASLAASGQVKRVWIGKIDATSNTVSIVDGYTSLRDQFSTPAIAGAIVGRWAISDSVNIWSQNV